MYTTSKIPIPPRTAFPSLPDALTIANTSERVRAFVSSLFEHERDLEKPQFSSDAPLEPIREYFDAFDEKLRVAFLQAEILHDAFEKAKTVFLNLDMLRREEWWSFRENEPRPCGGAKLPLELVSSVCSMDCAERNHYEGPAGYRTPYSLGCWGGLYFKAGEIHVKASEVAKKSSFIARAGRLILDADEKGSVSSACATTQKWMGLTASVSKEEREGPTALFEVLNEAEDVLPRLQRLCVPFGSDFQDYVITTGPDGDHSCTACQGHPTSSSPTITLPRCKTADIPLAFLPFLGQTLTNLVHLTIHFPRDQHTGHNFGSHFHHLALERLQSLCILGQADDHDDALNVDFVSRGPILDVPSLTSLAIIFHHLEGSAVSALLKRLNCPKLQCAILSDLFVLPFDAREDENGNIPYYDKQPFLNQFEHMLDVLNDRCKELKRLSFYIDHFYRNSNICSPWSDIKPTNMVHDFLFVLYKSLSVGSSLEGVTSPELFKWESVDLKLPKLEYLSIPFDTYNFAHDSVSSVLLGCRIALKSPLRTLEISPQPYHHDAEYHVQHIHLFVDHVITTDTDISDFFNGCYFSTM